MSVKNHHDCIDRIVEENRTLKVEVHELEISLRGYQDDVYQLKKELKELKNGKE